MICLATISHISTYLILLLPTYLLLACLPLLPACLILVVVVLEVECLGGHLVDPGMV